MFPSPIEAQAGLQENIKQEKVVLNLAKTKIKNEIAAVLWNMRTLTETFMYTYAQETEETLIEIAQELLKLGFKLDLSIIGDQLRLKVGLV